MPVQQFFKKTFALPAFFVALIVFVSCSSRQHDLLPGSLSELKLVKITSGSEAAQIVNRMHGKNVTPNDNVIGHYQGNKGEVTLYVSVYNSPSEANQAERKMRDRIATGNGAFTHYRLLTLYDKPVVMCLGMGLVHYFFSHQTKLYWLAADTSLAQQTLIVLLQTMSTVPS